MPSEPAVFARGVGVTAHRRLRWGGRGPAESILDSVDLEIPVSVCWGLTGPSGCGKSTLARCLARIQRPDRGSIGGAATVQLVMQDPGASLNPGFTAADVIDEPLVIHGDRRSAAAELMSTVGLHPADASRPSSTFSGGQKARLAIARALASFGHDRPGLLIFDESFASLDFETLEQILNLLSSLRERRALSYLVISHELDLLRAFTSRTLTMQHGRLLPEDRL